MTSIFEGQPPKTRPFPIKTRVIWVQGIYDGLGPAKKNGSQWIIKVNRFPFSKTESMTFNHGKFPNVERN